MAFRNHQQKKISPTELLKLLPSQGLLLQKYVFLKYKYIDSFLTNWFLILLINFQLQRKVITSEVPTFHRRTESYDDSQHQTFFIERDSEGSSSTHTTGASLQCGSPFLSASPRQRNRIRTNPWLGAEKTKAYNSQGETSSTVGSSSTLSSTGCKERLPSSRNPEEVKNLNLLRNTGTYIASP